MKKKIISFMVIVIAVMIVFTSTMLVMASISEDTLPATKGNVPSLTDSEAGLADKGYVAYVTHSGITSKTSGAVQVDGVWAMAFKWLTPGDTTKAKFEAFFSLPCADRSKDEVAEDYIEYPYGDSKAKNYLTDTAWGYAASLDGANVVFLKDIYCIGPVVTIKTGSKSSDKTDIIENGGAICIQKDRTIEGNGHTLYMEGPIISGNGVAITVNWNNINIQTNSVSSAIMFKMRSTSAATGNVNFTNCTFTTGAISAYNGDASLFLSENGKVKVSLTDCTIDFDASVYDSSSNDISVFKSKSTYSVSYTLNTCDLVFDTDAVNSYIFASDSSTCSLNIDLTNITSNTMTSAPNAHFFKGGSSKGSGNVVDITDCDIKTGGYGFCEMKKGFITMDGATRFQTDREAIIFEGTDISNVIVLEINDKAKIVAPELAVVNVTSGGVVNAVTVNADHSNFYYATVDDEMAGIAKYSAPTLIDGATVRMNDDSRGIRFSATNVDASADDYGMLINKGEEAPNLNSFTYKADRSRVTVDNGGFSVALTGDTLGIVDKYSARTYAEYKLNSDYTVNTENDCKIFANITVYSSFDIQANSRSLGFAADEAVRDIKDEKDEANGYIYEVLPCKFSRYGEYQYGVLQALKTEYESAIG